MDKNELLALYDLVKTTVHDLCYPFITKTEKGIRVQICEKDIFFTYEELLAKKSSAKEFFELFKRKLWGGKND